MPPIESKLPFANVVLAIATPELRQPLTYAIPPELTNALTPGACVVVPIGTRETTGYVVSFLDSLPADVTIEQIRPILAQVAGDGATLPPAVLATARWISQTYFCDLATTVQAAIPGGLSAQIVRKCALSPDWEAHLANTNTLSHRELLMALSQMPDGVATEKELETALKSKVASPITLLKKRGAIVDRWVLAPPRVAPRRVKMLRLRITWDDAEVAAQSREAKAPAQARLLRTIAQTGGQMPLAEALSEAQASGGASVKRLVDDGLILEEVVTVRRKPFRVNSASVAPPILTPEQDAAVTEIRRRLDTRQANTVLLYGVTASGKTEVYLRAIAEVRRRKRTALVLVPEIALTAQLMDNFRARIGDRVAVLHSALSAGERRDEWQRIAAGEADVVVGARSAIFAPLENVGLIVVDEEHEGSYKQDKPAPRYNARDVAVARAKATGATVVLGSATPSVESFYRAESGEYGFIPLRQRALSRPLPTVEVVDLRAEWMKGATTVFAPQLNEAILDRLEKREQTILFLNRRGFAHFLLCRDCGFTTRCPRCDVSLTFYANRNKIICHHCNYERDAPTICPSCEGTRIRSFGIGTEKVEEEVRRLFPDARVLRLDRDTVTKKDALPALLRSFRSGEADILIGTQMVAKGLDFAGVTLVGVVSADTALNLPDFRASERAFQLLTQVSGRAGRGRKPGHVLVQTFNPENESIVAAAEHDYETFYRREIENRRELMYPPFSRLANIVSQDENVRAAESRLQKLAEILGGSEGVFGENTEENGRVAGNDDFQVLGPAPCPLSRLHNQYRWHLLVKARSFDDLRRRLRSALNQLTSSERFSLTIDLDPMSLL